MISELMKGCYEVLLHGSEISYCYVIWAARVRWCFVVFCSSFVMVHLYRNLAVIGDVHNAKLSLMVK